MSTLRQVWHHQGARYWAGVIAVALVVFIICAVLLTAASVAMSA